jgi:hypothetical protein
MPRLPIPEQDDNSWGAILKFLRVSHREDGSLRGVTNGINVHDFGAKGDGGTDDTLAIQSALNIVESAGGVVRILAGTYLVSTTRLIASKELPK